MEHSRQYIRLQVPGQFGELQISAIGGKRINSNSRKVLILDISPGGFRFLSGLKFPDAGRLRITMLTTLSGIRFEAEGTIIWRAANENLYEYGVQFDITELHRSFMIRMLNQLYMQQRPELKRIHQYYNYMCHVYIERQRSRINFDCRT